MLYDIIGVDPCLSASAFGTCFIKTAFAVLPFPWTISRPLQVVPDKKKCHDRWVPIAAYQNICMTTGIPCEIVWLSHGSQHLRVSTLHRICIAAGGSPFVSNVSICLPVVTSGQREKGALGWTVPLTREAAPVVLVDRFLIGIPGV